ncbi:MAG: hypothetical protein K6C08_00235 [Oscillospiraceae bacterium]|nr:hypothetical protein [Oscillospiraceae bacterium]
MHQRCRDSLSLLFAVLIFFSLTRPAFAEEAGGVQEKTESESFEITEEWFDSALFIGDSQTGGLASYTMMYGGLGDALVYYVVGLSCYNIVHLDQRLYFKGEYHTIENMVAASGAEKVFLSLAINDVEAPVDVMRDCWSAMLERIREKNPEVSIYVQSCPEIGQDYSGSTGRRIRSYNRMLKEVCEERDCSFVDITAGLTDGNGLTKQSYLRDNIHLNEEGCRIWLRNLCRPESYSIPPEA